MPSDPSAPPPPASDPSECPGKGRCHGCMDWCSICGSVRHVCDVRLEGRRCDEHPVPPDWPALKARRRHAEAAVRKASVAMREAGQELESVADLEQARRAFSGQIEAAERRFWPLAWR
jgi:hypothetical protein